MTTRCGQTPKVFATLYESIGYERNQLNKLQNKKIFLDTQQRIKQHSHFTNNLMSISKYEKRVSILHRRKLINSIHKA